MRGVATLRVLQVGCASVVVVEDDVYVQDHHRLVQHHQLGHVARVPTLQQGLLKRLLAGDFLDYLQINLQLYQWHRCSLYQVQANEVAFLAAIVEVVEEAAHFVDLQFGVAIQFEAGDRQVDVAGVDCKVARLGPVLLDADWDHWGARRRPLEDLLDALIDNGDGCFTFLPDRVQLIFKVLYYLAYLRADHLVELNLVLGQLLNGRDWLDGSGFVLLGLFVSWPLRLGGLVVKLRDEGGEGLGHVVLVSAVHFKRVHQLVRALLQRVELMVLGARSALFFLLILRSRRLRLLLHRLHVLGGLLRFWRGGFDRGCLAIFGLVHELKRGPDVFGLCRLLLLEHGCYLGRLGLGQHRLLILLQFDLLLSLRLCCCDRFLFNRLRLQ